MSNYVIIYSPSHINIAHYTHSTLNITWELKHACVIQENKLLVYQAGHLSYFLSLLHHFDAWKFFAYRLNRGTEISQVSFKYILIYASKMNESLMGLERHEVE